MAKLTTRTGLEQDPIHAIVADDDPLARAAIKDALRRAGIVVVADAHNGREAVELCMHYRPDVVLMDVVMPELDGISATRMIRNHLPEQIIVILTSADEQELGLIGLRAGATGFLSKDVDLEAVPRAVEGAYRGEAVVSRRLGAQLLAQLRRIPEATTGLRPIKSPLTPREWEVVDLLSEAKSTDEMASILVLSPETVRTHVKHILRKLNASSRDEAVAIAREMRRGPSGA